MTKWVTILVIALSPSRYLAISPSEFYIETNSMWIVDLGF